jgi:hypothetical protein
VPGRWALTSVFPTLRDVRLLTGTGRNNEVARLNSDDVTADSFVDGSRGVVELSVPELLESLSERAVLLGLPTIEADHLERCW